MTSSAILPASLPLRPNFHVTDQLGDVGAFAARRAFVMQFPL